MNAPPTDGAPPCAMMRLHGRAETPSAASTMHRELLGETGRRSSRPDGMRVPASGEDVRVTLANRCPLTDSQDTGERLGRSQMQTALVIERRFQNRDDLGDRTREQCEPVPSYAGCSAGLRWVQPHRSTVSRAIANTGSALIRRRSATTSGKRSISGVMIGASRGLI